MYSDYSNRRNESFCVSSVINVVVLSIAIIIAMLISVVLVDILLCVSLLAVLSIISLVVKLKHMQPKETFTQNFGFAR